MEPADRTQVLIVGAGPVGLSLAIELGIRGIQATIIDRRDRMGPQPRAKTTNTRSMAHMRRWGIADRLRSSAPLPASYPTDVIFATKLFGLELAVFRNAFAGDKAGDQRFPEPAQWVPQYIVERVLQEKVAQLPSIRFLPATELEDLTQSEAMVSATVRDTQRDTRRVIEADYVVGADGARSTVRKSMGGKMIGEYAMSHTYSVILRIPELKRAPPPRQAIMYWLVNPNSPGVLSTIDGDETWSFGVGISADAEDIADDVIISRVHQALGREMPVEIVERDRWAAHRLIADKYRDRRVVLAGDACHLHPPYGGYGMNLGIADAVDLGWKLSALLEGWGGDALLVSYEIERRPVHQRTISEAVTNFQTLSAHLLREGLEQDTLEGEALRHQIRIEILEKKSREFNTLGVVLGSRYENSSIIVQDGSTPPQEHYSEYTPSAHPGCLAPHAWLKDGRSLYDNLGLWFTLLVLDESFRDLAAEIAQSGEAVRLPIKTLDLAGLNLTELYGAPLILVRPDQFVAWRGREIDPATLVNIVRGANSCA